MTFKQAFIENSPLHVKKAAKSDIHNHAGRGGNMAYIAGYANVKISPANEPFENLAAMNEWFKEHIKIHCPGIKGYLKRIEAAFVQAKDDNIAVLSMSFTIEEIDFLGGIGSFVPAVDLLHKTFAPDTSFYPELTIVRESNIEKAYDRLDEIFEKKWFQSIDVCGNEFARPIGDFKAIYRKAEKTGLKLKAHAGELGSAQDVVQAVEELHLSEIHHGIGAAGSAQAMKFLVDRKIRLNICLTSNIMLRRAFSYKTHPIKILYDYGIPLTINTDDMLIFNQSVSEEYLHLYRENIFSPDQLEHIRITGLGAYASPPSAR